MPGRAFAAITVAPALLAVAWLVPGTGMLLAGRLAAVPMMIIFVPLAVALGYFAMGRLPASWPRFIEAELNLPSAVELSDGAASGALDTAGRETPARRRQARPRRQTRARGA